MAEPAEEFSVFFDLDPAVVTRLQHHNSLDEAVFGMLDVLAAARRYPVFGISIRFLRAEIHPVHPSPPIAFRMAGRDAARRILEEEQRTRTSPQSGEASSGLPPQTQSR